MTDPDPVPLSPGAELRATDQLKALQANLLAEHEQLDLRRRELTVQLKRVVSRMKKIKADLGLPPRFIQSQQREGRIEVIRRLMHAAGGPMTIASVCRELEASEGKNCSQQKAWNILAANPESFVNVGFGLWDLRERHTPEEVSEMKRRRDALLAEISSVGNAAKRSLK